MATVKTSRYYTYIKPVVQNPFVKSFTPYIFSLMTLIVFAIFAIRPTVSTILNLQQNVDNNQKILDQLDLKARNLSEGKHNLDTLDEEIKRKISDSIPLQANVTSLVSNLQNSSNKQASTSALQIQPLTIFDAAQKKGTGDLAEVNFSYNLQGSYDQLLTILSNIKKSSRLISITNIVLSKQTEDTLVLSITGKSYFLK